MHDELLGREHPQPKGDLGLVAAVAVNALLTGVQIVGGIVAGSLALVADALHNANDAASLALALVARRIARRPADHRRTFGYRRAEVIGALVNLTALLLIGVYLVYEAILRLFDPVEIDGWIVVWVACLALVVDLATAALTWAMSRGNLNIKAAFVHNVSDALGSLVVIVAGALIILYDWRIADVIGTLAIAGYVFYQSIGMLRQAVRILMESVPKDIDLAALVRSMGANEHVVEVHHVHVWELDENHRALEAHIVIDEANLRLVEQIKRVIKEQLAREQRIHHTTLEIEIAPSCPDTAAGTCLV